MSSEAAHRQNIARLSNLGSTLKISPLPSPKASDEEEEDPEEIAYRERLRKLAEEDDDPVPDLFGIGNGFGRNTAASTYDAERLNAETQRALDVLRRTAKASVDLSDGGYFMTEQHEDDDSDDAFKAQQARLRALAAAAQPASQVIQQVKRSNVPRPPGLSDPHHQKVTEERYKRLNQADTAAFVAIAGTAPDEIKDILETVTARPTIESTLISKSIISKPTVLPPPGLGNRSSPQTNFTSTNSPKPTLTNPDSLQLPGLSRPKEDPASFSLIKTQTSNIEIDKKVSSSDIRKSFVSEKDSNEKKGILTDEERTNIIHEKRLSSAASVTSKKISEAGLSVSTVQSKASSTSQLPTSKRSTAQSSNLPREFFNIFTWKNPVNSLSWFVFSIFIVLTSISGKWSTLTVWTSFAFLRIFLLKISRFLRDKIPEPLSNKVLPKDQQRLPGSFHFIGEILFLFAKLLREISVDMENDNISLISVLLPMTILGMKLNLLITLVMLLFLLSLTLVCIIYVPSHVYSPILRRFPIVEKILNSFDIENL